MSRSYPRAIIAAPIVGSTSPSVWRAAVSAASSSSASSSLTRVGRPADAASDVDLRIGPKSRCGSVDGVEFGVDLPAGGGQRIGIGDDDLHAGTPALPLRCRGVRAGVSELLGGDGHEPREIVTCGE